MTLAQKPVTSGVMVPLWHIPTTTIENLMIGKEWRTV